MRCRRDGVVGGLRHVDVRIGMHGVLSLVTGHQFVGQIADHFIDVHIDAGVAAALPHIERKLLFKSSGDHFVASLFNGYCNFGLQSSDFGVG